MANRKFEGEYKKSLRNHPIIIDKHLAIWFFEVFRDLLTILGGPASSGTRDLGLILFCLGARFQIWVILKLFHEIKDKSFFSCGNMEIIEIQSNEKVMIKSIQTVLKRTWNQNLPKMAKLVCRFMIKYYCFTVLSDILLALLLGHLTGLQDSHWTFSFSLL